MTTTITSPLGTRQSMMKLGRNDALIFLLGKLLSQLASIARNSIGIPQMRSFIFQPRLLNNPLFSDTPIGFPRDHLYLWHRFHTVPSPVWRVDDNFTNKILCLLPVQSLSLGLPGVVVLMIRHYFEKWPSLVIRSLPSLVWSLYDGGVELELSIRSIAAALRSIPGSWHLLAADRKLMPCPAWARLRCNSVSREARLMICFIPLSTPCGGTCWSPVRRYWRW